MRARNSNEKAHSVRKAIVDFLRKNPGTGGGDVARGLGYEGAVKIQGHLARLKKQGVIRQKGINSATRWYAVEGVEPPPPQKPGVKAGMRTANAGTCEYHRTHPLSGECHRCLDYGAQTKEKKKSDSLLRSMFPVIFGGAE